MGVMNLLADAGMPIYSQLHSVSLNWIGKIILWLTTVCGSVGVGIILFSLLLKVVTMPFDVFQRINMRKQNIKMKENQARMEKLQKQYANDKDKYNQKKLNAEHKPTYFCGKNTSLYINTPAENNTAVNNIT